MRLQWDRPPAELDRLVRLGGAWTTFRGKRLKVLAAEPLGVGPEDIVGGDVLDGDRVGGLRLLRVQPEGKGPMAFADFARGNRPAPGERLGEAAPRTSG